MLSDNDMSFVYYFYYLYYFYRPNHQQNAIKEAHVIQNRNLSSDAKRL